ncbi:hypothetical protein BD310DRAFT_426779 [Dichomitus squalens]|uniref:Uncharacterized protein n=1 Tax=Dichomitus squalens TaxID=114155 RepID=A0A4Q9PXE3_9APHY|nr:hypothetical protein BD310DRAFT_426779 [Dichomitus squalens]
MMCLACAAAGVLWPSLSLSVSLFVQRAIAIAMMIVVSCRSRASAPRRIAQARFPRRLRAPPRGSQPPPFLPCDGRITPVPGTSLRHFSRPSPSHIQTSERSCSPPSKQARGDRETRVQLPSLPSGTFVMQEARERLEARRHSSRRRQSSARRAYGCSPVEQMCARLKGKERR